MKERPVGFQDRSDGSCRELGAAFRKYTDFCEVIKSRAQIRFPSSHSTADNSFVIIVPSRYWHSITLWSSASRSHSVCKFLFLERWTSVQQSGLMSQILRVQNELSLFAPQCWSNESIIFLAILSESLDVILQDVLATSIYSNIVWGLIQITKSPKLDDLVTF